MYHCHIQFYCMGEQPGRFSVLRETAPLKAFTHAFSHSAAPDAELAAQADVIFADLGGIDAEAAVRALLAARKPGAAVIALAETEQAALLAEGFPELADIWRLPMSEAELRFRFVKWQRDCKSQTDGWEAQNFLDASINGSPNLVWFKDRNGIHEKVNDSFCQTVRKTRQEVEGHRHCEIWDVPNDDPACIESERQVMVQRKTCVSEEHVQSGEGEKLLTTYKSPLYDLDGSVMGTVGVAIDATQVRAYEQMLVDRNRMLEGLFSTLDCGVVSHSLDGKHIYNINRAALRLLGYASEQEMVEDGFSMVAQSVLDEDKPRLRECIASLKEPGDSTGVEYGVQHADGTRLHILGNVKLVEKNGVRYYQRFLLDFTAQKIREEQIFAEKDLEIEYQEQMMDVFATYLSSNIDDVYLMIDGAGLHVEFVSPNVERVLGIGWDEVGNGLEQFLPEKYISGEKISRTMLNAMQPGDALEPVETERIQQKTGEHRWFQETVYCASVQNAKKIIVYISDRTREWQTRNALAEALDIAQVANKAKSTFLGNVSHDIRTPMNAITGFLTLLREEPDNPEHVLDYTQKISAASQHLLGLINDVLDMNKIESGSTVLNISEVNLAEVIEELNTIIRPQARAKKQVFEIYTDSLTREHLLGDKLRINQILINILSNAVKYTPEGGRIEMWVRELTQVDEKYSRISFSIRDTGNGMSEEYQQVIFDPFTREQNVRMSQIQGTGLGMAITKSLVDLMGGTISVQSKLGEGSTFTVELELRVQETEDDPAFWDKHCIARMIVADDNEDICRDIVKKMSETGVKTDYATGGIEAISMMRAARERGTPYDLMLLDWQMPDLDGMATARLIQKNYPDKIPILLFSAYDWVEIEQEALEVGISHFMPKPFFMCNFKDAIRRMMGSRMDAAVDSAGDNVVRGRRIMVVDDIDVNRIILVKILSSLGAECDTAEDGKDALDKFERSVPGWYDIILMDVQMPVMNGYDATRAIRASAHPSAQSVAIIAMTANAFVDDIREALASGMDAHVAKPIIVDQLKATIREVQQKKALENKT